MCLAIKTAAAAGYENGSQRVDIIGFEDEVDGKSERRCGGNAEPGHDGGGGSGQDEV